MPLWQVTGADQATGEEQTHQIEAASAEAAEFRARAGGMLVSTVSEVDALDVIAATVAPPIAEYRSQQTQSPRELARVPGYPAIVYASVALRVCAIFFALVAFGTCLTTVYALVQSPFYSNAFSALTSTAALSGYFFGGILLAVAVFLYGVAHLFLAVRDMARNSFRD